MTGAGLLGLLLLKHGVLAHVIDFGYSASRRSAYRFWYVALILQCLAEMVGTLFVLSNYSLDVVTVVLLIEITGLATTSVLERDAPLGRLLVRHVLCEFAMVAVYVSVASFLVARK
jgi:hypothetical protein